MVSNERRDAIPAMNGNYLTVLSSLHRHLRPKTYLEIGTLTGQTLELAHCASIAIDPAFKITSDVMGQKPSLALFQSTSDDYFQHADPKQQFGRAIDLAFLDGMHLYEFLLRDFRNVERSCRRNSIIALHDCMPLDDIMTSRSPQPPRSDSLYPNYWTGDVWKVLPILREYRPDLKIYAVPAHPTGLILITHLSPDSDVIDKHYDDILVQYRDITLSEFGFEKLYGSLAIIEAQALNSLEDISKYFFL